jgi:RimJ/RimL family protein N-acetyltransferase
LPWRLNPPLARLKKHGVVWEGGYIVEQSEFKKRALSLLFSMKHEYSAERDALSIPVFKQGRVAGRLRPIHAGFLQSDLELLSRWRNRYREAFLTWTHSTVDSARRWLTQDILARPDRILFFAETSDGKPFGHIGLTNFNYVEKSAELDNWIKDADRSCELNMGDAIHSLMDWTFSALLLHNLRARVFSDNLSIRFHRLDGFEEEISIPLEKQMRDGQVCWVETAERTERSEKHLICLRIQREGYRPLNWPISFFEGH